MRHRQRHCCTRKIKIRLRLGQLRQAKVQNLDPAVLGDEEVLGLEVAVDDAFFVSRRHSVSDLHGGINRLPERQRAMLQLLP